MERRRHEKRTSGRAHVERSGGRGVLATEEDYGDYVTRCICDFKHDDGYMICCDKCSVWQHLECMQVDPKNLPENYLCELCEPRSVDKKRAQKIQLKKREDISDAEESRRGRRTRSPLPRTPLATVEPRKVTTSTISATSSSAATTATPAGTGGALAKKRKKRVQSVDSKTEGLKRVRKERGETPASAASKKLRCRPAGKPAGTLTSGSSIQSLLTAASLLEGEEEQEEGQEHNQLWNAEKSPWTDKYEIADENLTMGAVVDYVQEHLEQLHSEAVVYSREEFSSTNASQHHQPQCSMEEVGPRRMGVVVREAVPQDELVMEYKGKVTVSSDVLTEFGMSGRGSSLWKHKPCPFVYLYDKIVNLDLCIDSRNYGNLARFIRRSCSPNAELRHFFVSNELHFGVYALDHLSPDEEVLLPFDFLYDKCLYAIECGCGQSPDVCLLVSANKEQELPAAPPTTSARRKSSTCVPTEDEQPSFQSRNVTLPKSRSHAPTDDESNMSWTSTSSAGKKKVSCAPPPHSPDKEQGSHPPSREGSSPSDEDGEDEHEKPTKSLSREERKTEQVWRVFEKMEASAQRKKQLLSDGSHESDPASEVSPLQSAIQRGLKDRCLSSSSSRRVQLLPHPTTVTMRLSSVSSADPLSPYAPSDAFSPPMTPGLAPPRSPAHFPHFHAAPELHPKYLFSDFALPWKKAILRQWELEQQGGGDSAVHRSYWASNLSDYAYLMGTNLCRPRPIGCLKHRWLRHYHGDMGQKMVDEAGRGLSSSLRANVPARGLGQARGAPPASAKEGRTSLSSFPLEDWRNDKENRQQSHHGNRTSSLPHKKRVLLRWQRSGGVATATPTSPPTPLDAAALTARAEEESEQVTTAMHKSPLFEEFSDTEELMVDQDMGGAGTGYRPSPRVLSGPRLLDVLGGEEVKDVVGVVTSPSLSCPPSSTPANPPSPSRVDVDLTQTSRDDQSGLLPVEDKEMGSSAGDPMENWRWEEEEEEEKQLSGVSDISVDSTADELASLPMPLTFADGGQCFKPATAPIPVSMDGSVSSENLEGPVTPHTTPPPLEQLEGSGEGEDERGVAKDSSVTEGLTYAESADSAEAMGMSEDADGGCGQYDSVLSTTPTSPQPTPLKTPGKRKINLSEYRNRAARRPAERKGSSENKVLSTPPSTPGTPSFLAGHPSLFASSLQHSSMAHAVPADPGTYFEPVSPDEDDHTPKLHNRDEVVTSVSSVVPANIGVPTVGGVASGGVASSMAYSCTPGSNLYNPYSGGLQPGGVANVRPGGVMAGGVGSVMAGGVGSVMAGGVGSVMAGGVASVMAGGVASVMGGYVVDGAGVRWGAGDQSQDPRSRTIATPSASSGGLIPMAGGAGVLPASILLQPPQGSAPGALYSQPPQATTPGVLYTSQPPQASGGLYSTQPPAYYQHQLQPAQQTLNLAPPGTQGGVAGGPGIYRAPRHAPGLGGSNSYY